MNKIIGFAGLVLISFASLAQSEKDEIERLKQEVERYKVLAAENAKRAEEADARAQRLRYITISKALAQKSKEISSKELAGLLVLQAHRFNITHNGYDFDSDLFSALNEMLFRLGIKYKADESFLNLNRSGNFEVSTSPNGLILLKKGGATFSLYGHQAKVNQYTFTNNGYFLVTGDESGVFKIWNLEYLTNYPATSKVGGAIKKLEFSKDDALLRVTFSNSSTQLFLLNHRQMATELEKYISRNLTREEWEIFIAPDLPYEKTVDSLPEGN